MPRWLAGAVATLSLAAGACGSRAPDPSPTPLGLPAARTMMCRDYYSTGALYGVTPLGEQHGGEAADAWDQAVAALRADADVLDAANAQPAAAATRRLADALATVADDVRMPPPTDPADLAAWQEEAEARRRALLGAAHDAAVFIRDLCKYQMRRG